MATVKKISPQKNAQLIKSVLTYRDGWNFGIGFFFAAFVFSFVIVPAIICMALSLLSILGGVLPSG